MRVAICLPAYAPAVEYGGPVTKARGLAHGLQSLGHDVTIWCADYGADGTRTAPGPATVDGTTVHYFPRIVSYRFLPVVRGVTAHVERARPDVVHCIGLRDGLTYMAARAARACNIPYVVEPAGMARRRGRNIAAKTAFDELVGRRHITRAALLIATSRLEQRELENQFDTCTVVVRHNPVSLPIVRVCDRAAIRERFGIPRDAFVVTSVARISAKKAFDVLVRAVATCRDVHVVIAGPDAGDGGVALMRRAIAASGTGDRVHVFPSVWGKDRDELVAASDAFALVSWNENFGTAAAEAAALGIPVIVTEQCGVAELIERTGTGIVCPIDEGAIADAIHKIKSRSVVVGGAGPAADLHRLLDPLTIARQQEAIYVRATGRSASTSQSGTIEA